MKKENSSYKKNNSFSYIDGNITFPLPILVSTKNKLKKTNDYARNFNFIVVNIWLTALLLRV